MAVELAGLDLRRCPSASSSSSEYRWTRCFATSGPIRKVAAPRDGLSAHRSRTCPTARLDQVRYCSLTYSALQLPLRRLLARAFVGAQRPDDVLHLDLKLLRILLPAGKVGGLAFADAGRVPAFPLEKVTVKVQRNQRQHPLLALLPKALLFFKGLASFFVHPE